MKSPDTRFYVPELTKGVLPLSAEESAHAIRVCRARPGDILQLTDGKGHLATGIVEKADPHCCEIRVESIKESNLSLIHI